MRHHTVGAAGQATHRGPGHALSRGSRLAYHAPCPADAPCSRKHGGGRETKIRRVSTSPKIYQRPPANAKKFPGGGMAPF